MSYIGFEKVCKVYGTGESAVRAADDVSFGIEQGELCVVLGPSGAGKTTVLNLLGGMDKATSGKIVVGQKEITGMHSPQLTEYRRLDVGFVFQFYNLMPSLTALENVELARQVCPAALDPQTVLRQVGLEGRINNFPSQLSGGEQQRVSIARALCKNPALLLCDEPTGALDSKTGEQVLALLKTVSQTYRTTVVIITHNASIASLGDRVIRMLNGRIAENTVNEHPARLEDIAW
jgi:putative ABC transport system ATP-binding protein